MPHGRPVSWTPEQDQQLRDLRAAGLLWSQVGAVVGRDGACCRLRITKVLGEPDPLPQRVAPSTAVADRRHDAARPVSCRLRSSAPLPPGDPSTWGLLTVGTVLEGSAYE